MPGWTVEITITDGGRRLLTEPAMPLPIRITREGDTARAILTDGSGQRYEMAQGRSDVSRDHMTLSCEDDGSLVVADQSTNGVYVMERSAPRLIGDGSAMVVPPGASVHLETVGFEFRVQCHPPPVARVKSQLHAEVRLGGKLHRIALDNDPLVVADGALAQGFGYSRHRDLDALLAALAGRVAVIVAPGRDGTMHVVATVGADARLNRKSIPTDQPQAVMHGALVTFEGGHLHLLEAGADRQLACVNDQCLMLNDYAPGSNCGFCGTRLGDAHTRFIR